MCWSGGFGPASNRRRTMRQGNRMAFAFVSVFLMSGAGAGTEALPAASVAQASMQNAPPEEPRVLRLAQNPPATPEVLPTAPTRGRPPLPPFWTTFPGEFAMRTQKGYYLTAINGGGRPNDPLVITAATTAGPLEKFRLAAMNPPPPNDKSIQTASG